MPQGSSLRIRYTSRIGVILNTAVHLRNTDCQNFSQPIGSLRFRQSAEMHPEPLRIRCL